VGEVERNPRGAPVSNAWGTGLAGIGASIFASYALTASPTVAIVGAPLAFGAMDALVSATLASDGPPFKMRVAARCAGSVLFGCVLWMALSLRSSTRLASQTAWLLPMLAIGGALAVVVGTWGSAGLAPTAESRGGGPVAESPVLGLLDAGTTVWAFLLSTLAHEAPVRARIVICAALGTTLLARALAVAVLARHGATHPFSPTLAALGFVGWLGAAGLTCTIAATPIAWSGLGAAVVLTLASILAELRRKRAAIALLRASLGCAVAAMLGVLSILVS